jgi:hypothetical protein
MGLSMAPPVRAAAPHPANDPATDPAAAPGRRSP